MAKATSARRYTDEFKKDAVALLRSSGRPIKEVARQLAISGTSLGAWAREMSENAEPGDAELEREAARLRKRIKELETEIDILKKFTAYWVKGSP
jgi:transposase